MREAAEMFENKPGVVTTACFAWHPSDAFKRGINWSAFLAAENVASYALLERKAASNPEWVLGRADPLSRLEIHKALFARPRSNPVPIADQAAGSIFPREGLSDLVCNPLRGWICCDVDPDKISARQPEQRTGPWRRCPPRDYVRNCTTAGWAVRAA